MLKIFLADFPEKKAEMSEIFWTFPESAAGFRTVLKITPARDTTLTLAAETPQASPAPASLYLHITKRVRVRFSDHQVARSRREIGPRECEMLCPRPPPERSV